MKRTFFALLLIALIAGQEVNEVKKKIEEAKTLEETKAIEVTKAIEEKPELKFAVTTIILTSVISVTVGFVLTKVFEKIHYQLTVGYTVDTYNENGKGRWLSDIKDGVVMSAYYHKTKKHSATCQGGFGGGGQIRAIAPAGQWAIALCYAGISGRKTFWNVLE